LHLKCNSYIFDSYEARHSTAIEESIMKKAFVGICMLMVVVAISVSAGCTPGDDPGSGQPAVAQQDGEELKSLAASLTKYYLGVMRPGPNWSASAPEEMQKIRKENEDDLADLVVAGKLVGIVTLKEPKDFYGIVFFKVDTEEEVMAIADNAPSVKAGLITFKVHKVWGTRGMGKTFRKKLEEQSDYKGEQKPYFMVAYTKGEDWAAEPDAESRALLADQTAYMMQFVKSGVLRYYCAFDNLETEVRGVSIFSVDTKEEVEEIVSNGPEVKAGAIQPHVFPVLIAKGVLP
jgi:hypothetical protein